MLFKFPPALRHRDFRLLWAGQAVSIAGSRMQAAAILWQVYAITDYLDGYSKKVMGTEPHARYDLNDDRISEKGWFA